MSKKRLIGMTPRPSHYSSMISGTINGRPATPMEIAAMKKAMMPVLGHVNTQLGHVGVQLGQMRKQQAGLLQGGAFSPQVRLPTKQPQDKVLRLVTRRGEEMHLVAHCVIMALVIMICAFGMAFTSNAGSWIGVIVFVIPLCIAWGLLVVGLKNFFKTAETKADLLNWPDQ